MANKKISELQSRTPALSDLMLVGDPSSGYSYKCTVTALATIIETDIADGFVTIGTTQTVSGAKTFSNNLTLTSVANTPTDPDKFLTLNASNVVTYRTGAEVLSDIGAQGSITLTTTGTSGAATLVGSTLNIPQYQSVLTNPVTGTGTTNYVTKWTSSSAVGNSQIIDNGTAIGIGTAPSNAYLLSVAGIYRGVGVGNAARIELYDTQSGGATFFISPQESLGVTSLGTYGAFPVLFVTNSAERIRISSAGDVTISTIANATVDTDKFLVSDSGVIKYRTGAEVLSDIGGASSSSISGTTNYIPKFTSSSAIGNSQIFDNGTNVGINNTSPSFGYGTGLQITSALASNLRINTTGYTGLDIIGGANGDGYIYLRDNNPLIFGTNNTERLRISSTGNVSIGNTNNTYKLDVSGQLRAAATDAHILQVADGSAQLKLERTNSSTGAMYLGADNVGLKFFDASFNTRMTLDASGNLGLGVTPSAWGSPFSNVLQLKYSAITGSGDGDMRFFTNAYYDGSNYRYIASAYAQRYDHSAGGHVWYTAPSGTAGNAISFTQAMTLTAAGRLLLGTATEGSYQLDINANGYRTFRIQGNDDVIMTIGSTIASSQNWTFGATANGSAQGSNLFFIGTSTNNPSGALTKNFQLASTGAATFSSSVTATNLNLSDAGGGAINNQNGNLFIQTSAGTGWIFRNGSPGFAEYMRITSGGEVLVATTTASFPGAGRGNITIGGSSSSILSFQTGGSNRGYLYHDGTGLYVNNFVSGSLSLMTNNTDRLWITSGGNVGIGTTNPTYKLVVSNGGDLGFEIDPTSSSGGIVSLLTYDRSAGSYKPLQINSEDIRFQTGTVSTEKMRITSGGEVLVGSTSSGLSSSGRGVIEINGTSESILGLKVNNVVKTYLYQSGDNVEFNNTANGYLALKTNASERMRITSGGDLLIGTTSEAGFVTIQNPSANKNGLNVISSATGASNYVLNLQSNASVANTAFLIRGYSNTNTGVFFVAGNGNIESAGSIKTGAPSGGTAKPWKLGEAGVTLGGSNTSGVRVEIDGTVYYLVTGYLP